MRTIHFKNGMTKQITQVELDAIFESYNKINNRLQGLANSDPIIYMVVNIDEIVYID